MMHNVAARATLDAAEIGASSTATPAGAASATACTARGVHGAVHGDDRSPIDARERTVGAIVTRSTWRRPSPPPTRPRPAGRGVARVGGGTRTERDERIDRLGPRAIAHP
jgi:hypothetical protein